MGKENEVWSHCRASAEKSKVLVTEIQPFLALRHHLNCITCAWFDGAIINPLLELVSQLVANKINHLSLTRVRCCTDRDNILTAWRAVLVTLDGHGVKAVSNGVLHGLLQQNSLSIADEFHAIVEITKAIASNLKASVGVLAADGNVFDNMLLVTKTPVFLTANIKGSLAIDIEKRSGKCTLVDTGRAADTFRIFGKLDSDDWGSWTRLSKLFLALTEHVHVHGWKHGWVQCHETPNKNLIDGVKTDKVAILLRVRVELALILSIAQIRNGMKVGHNFAVDTEWVQNDEESVAAPLEKVRRSTKHNLEPIRVVTNHFSHTPRNQHEKVGVVVLSLLVDVANEPSHNHPREDLKESGEHGATHKLERDVKGFKNGKGLEDRKVVEGSWSVGCVKRKETTEPRDCGITLLASIVANTDTGQCVEQNKAPPCCQSGVKRNHVQVAESHGCGVNLQLQPAKSQ
eukprot:m.270273 g.270273  ORF g.270273 m.270273 type:complete len:459 (+) comp15677_c0_seq4:5462-6838(+)